MSPCEAEEFLRSGGPRAVPLRICCVAALLQAGAGGPLPETAFGCPELVTTDLLAQRSGAPASAPASLTGPPGAASCGAADGVTGPASSAGVLAVVAAGTDDAVVLAVAAAGSGDSAVLPVAAAGTGDAAVLPVAAAGAGDSAVLAVAAAGAGDSAGAESSP